jgi:hypothetical protein
VEGHRSAGKLPTWIYKRDGRLVQFEADKISRALFAASQSLGQPNAFLSRELADGVMHFLAKETDDAIPSTAQLEELVLKVVRELGHPTLAQAYAFEGRQRRRKRESGVFDDTLEIASSRRTDAPAPDRLGPPLSRMRHWVQAGLTPREIATRAGNDSLREFALSQVFAPDVSAAHLAGLLQIRSLDAPFELAGGVLNVPNSQSRNFAESMRRACDFVSSLLAIDGPEWIDNGGMEAEDSSVEDRAREIDTALLEADVGAVLNLNRALPVIDSGPGPLFNRMGDLTSSRLSSLQLFRQCLQLESRRNGRLQLHWHLTPSDFDAEDNSPFHQVVAATGPGQIAFVFDRDNQAIALAEGLDSNRNHVLLVVGMDLSRLAELEGACKTPSLFLQKVESLARLARAAGVQKRNFLRSHSRSRLARSHHFNLERAQLLVAPLNLQRVTSLFFEDGIHDKRGASFAKDVLERIHRALEEDARSYGLETRLENCPGWYLLRDRQCRHDWLWSRQHIAITTADSALAPVSQLRSAAALFGNYCEGTLLAVIDPSRPIDASQVKKLLIQAWRQPEIRRLQFISSDDSFRQLLAPWEETILD